MSFSTGPSPLVLASGSAIRARLLETAGLEFSVERPRVDEDAIKQAARGGNEDLATALASSKAVEVGRRLPEAWTIGADSIAECDGRRFDKPRDATNAAEHLRFFSGRTLHLISAVAIARGERIAWHHLDVARLTVRQLSEEFIATYLKAEWPAIAACAGAFRLEERGVQLFETIDGSHFTVLGLPLLPLLDALRQRGAIVA